MKYLPIVKDFFKWLIFGQGIIWCVLTITMTILDFSVGEKEMIYTWIIAILFAVVLVKVDSVKRPLPNDF